jgi:hypothetical protein
VENEKSGRDGLDFSSLKKLNIRAALGGATLIPLLLVITVLDPGPDVMDSSSKYLAGPFVAVQILVQASDLACSQMVRMFSCSDRLP